MNEQKESLEFVLAGLRKNDSITFRVDREQVEKVDKRFQNDPGNIIFEAGYIPPSQIISYRCEKCAKEYDAALTPPIAEASIETSTSLRYKCGSCKEFICITPIRDAGNVPVKIITFDRTGKYKKPTPASIEELIGQAEKEALRGDGESIESPSFSEMLYIAQQWAKRIRYKIAPERIRELKTKWKECYLTRLEKELPDILAGINEKTYGFNLEEDELGITSYEATGMYERMERILELLRENRIPENNELKRDVLNVLFRHRNMFAIRKKALQAKKKDLEEKIDKQIGEMDADSSEANLTIDRYLAKVQLSKKEVTKIREEARVF